MKNPKYQSQRWHPSPNITCFIKYLKNKEEQEIEMLGSQFVTVGYVRLPTPPIKTKGKHWQLLFLSMIIWNLKARFC